MDGDSDKSDLIAPKLPDFPVASAGAVANFEGRAFCFFATASDYWASWGGKKRSEWNMYLLEDVVAPAYGYLLEKVASEIGPCDSFFSFWPTKMEYEPWASVVRKLYSFISDSCLRVLYTKARGGQWISTKQAIFPDFTFDKARELVDALSDAGLPLANIPEAIVENIKEICPGVHFLTPQLLRTLLIRRNREFRDRNAMILTLEYCLLELRTPVQSSTYFGLPLIPLSNGLFTKFQKRGESDRIYIAHGDGYGLLKDSLPHQLVDFGISAFLYDKLCEVARSKDFNITFLTSPLLERLFVQLLPADWQLAKQVNWVPGCQGHPDLEWMRLLWSYLKSCCEDLSLFSKWPILPVLNNRLLQLVENSNVIKDDGWSENMSSLLLRVGCLILTCDLPIDHPQLMRYVQPPTASGILNAMLAAAVKIEKIEGLFTNALDGEMHELRSYILQSKWFCEDSMNSTQMVIIKEIPMFESFKSRKMASLSRSTKWLKPNGVHEDLLNDDFLRIESDKERIILNKYLEVAEPTMADFVKHYVVKHMPEFISQDGLLSTILQDIKYLMEEDGSFKEAISKASFVLTRDGSWKEPISAASLSGECFEDIGPVFGDRSVVTMPLFGDRSSNVVPLYSYQLLLVNQQQQLQALQHGRVSAAELVQAVQEMLSAAGISMDVEKQSLLETTITLQEQLKDSQAALLLEQSGPIFEESSQIYDTVTTNSFLAPFDNMGVVDDILAMEVDLEDMESDEMSTQEILEESRVPNRLQTSGGLVSKMERYDELAASVEELSPNGLLYKVKRRIRTLLLDDIVLMGLFASSSLYLYLIDDKSDMATKEADTAKVAWLCRICLNTEVDVTIVPCGHVLCRRCSSAVSRCPFCRLQVSKVMRMFWP
ncbi:hypothetical protein RND71_034571 [Anisodus tanguticus]|uniref:RING-type domain-containing protein n=1 Tax=Anisodus tanguticus TaxID=243964 RepID=A0AAE1UYI0_9SOLA|nr:hypothetical protein RND71_034571 [Anisodus tanguticus]